MFFDNATNMKMALRSVRRAASIEAIVTEQAPELAK
jgi:hypothetical protein